MHRSAAYASIRALPEAADRPLSWLRRAEAFLDRRGKFGWITAMVLGFIFFWPLGLALLAYMIWGKQMFGKSCRNRDHHGHHHRGDARRAWAENWDRMSRAARPSGNAAFDAYKADTLRRLEEEQEAFETFLQRLREAKDKTEFDSFMEDRARNAGSQASETTEVTETTVETTYTTLPKSTGGAPASDPTARRGEY